MDGRELRIGNYIYKEGKTHHVDGIDLGLARREADYNIKIFKPIPLSEEWLVKFGWVWNDECDSYEKYPNGDSRMNLSFKESSGYTMFNYVLKAVIAKRIYYVHQLQNLHFALTGSELTIKE